MTDGAPTACSGGSASTPFSGFAHLFGPPKPEDCFLGGWFRDKRSEEAATDILKRLADTVAAWHVTTGNKNEWESPRIPAGHTYLLQLVGHDLLNTGLSSYELTGVERPVQNIRPATLGLNS